jgi:hypothetical protein
MPRLRTLGPLVRPLDTRSVRLPRRSPDPLHDPIYNSRAFRVWRTEVLIRAGYRCEALDQHGLRCTRAKPDRLYADHIVELRDGGSAFDVGNGMCLCASCHQLKTAQARMRRLRG